MGPYGVPVAQAKQNENEKEPNQNERDSFTDNKICPEHDAKLLNGIKCHSVQMNLI
nr:MAG TPA: hypothetical protein [Bacteriophage sp.]